MQSSLLKGLILLRSLTEKLETVVCCKYTRYSRTISRVLATFPFYCTSQLYRHGNRPSHVYPVHRVVDKPAS